MDSSGALLSENRYMPFGETRTISGTTNISETDFGYTGQRDYTDDFGLMDYRARFYSPKLGRFTQPDTIIPEPGNSQAWNRYSYTLNNPVKYNDPTGHEYGDGDDNFCTDSATCDLEEGDYPWDPNTVGYVDDVEAAEAAYAHFLEDPAYFAALYADPDAWYSSEEIVNLDVFFQYSQYHTTADRVISSGYDTDVAATLQTAHALYGMGDLLENVGNFISDIFNSDTGNSIISSAFFIGTEDGINIPIPDGWEGGLARNGKGLIYQLPGSTGNSNSIRIMDPNAKNPSGYVRVYNDINQPLTVYGKPGPEGETHIPMDYNGTINWPAGGWNNKK